MEGEGSKAKEESKSVGELIMMGERLKLGALVLGKREGKSTPSPPWKVGLVQADGTLVEDFDYSTFPRSSSVRKLGANLWENEPLLDIMSKDRLMNHHRSCNSRRQENDSVAVAEDSAAELNDPTQQPAKMSNGVRRRLGRIEQAREPPHQSLAPGPSYGSSSEMAHHIHRHAVTPNSSFDSQAKFIESSHGLKTSTELLKLLNRIWSLEERNTLNTSLVRTLKKELNKSHEKVKELLSEKNRDEKEIESLMKQLSELKVARNKEQDRVRDALKLMEGKLNDESKIRKSLEKHHKKLNQEISEMKSSFDGEVRARTMLEGLCDEFAKGIKDYERELRFLRQKFHVRDDGIVGESNDRLILHVSEAWLDERAHTKKLRGVANHENGTFLEKKKSTVENLYPEIEALLRAKRCIDDDGGKRIDTGSGGIPMQSMESLNVNEPPSAPWKGNEEDDDGEDYDSNSNYDTNGNNNNCLKLCSGMTSKQANGFKHQEETPQQNKPTSRNVLEGSFDPSAFVGPTSPVEKWTSLATSAAVDDHGIGEEASLKRHRSLKSNTLRAKLIEARLESQRSRGRSSNNPL